MKTMEQKLLSFLKRAENSWPEIGVEGWEERLEFYAYASKLLDLMFTEIKESTLGLSNDNKWETAITNSIDSIYTQAEVQFKKILLNSQL